MMTTRKPESTHAQSALLAAESTGQLAFSHAVGESSLLLRLVVRFLCLLEVHRVCLRVLGIFVAQQKCRGLR